VLVVMIAGCSTPLTTHEEGSAVATLGSTAGHNDIDNLKRDQDYESSRGRITD
jgi:hypothetical protein